MAIIIEVNPIKNATDKNKSQDEWITLIEINEKTENEHKINDIYKFNQIKRFFQYQLNNFIYTDCLHFRVIFLF